VTARVIRDGDLSVQGMADQVGTPEIVRVGGS